MTSSSIARTPVQRPSTTDAPLVILATFVPESGHEEAVRHALQAVLPATRSEPGCLRFDLYVSLEPVTTFRLFEIFRSQQAVDAHRDTDHYRTFRSAVMPLLATAPVVMKMAPLDVVEVP
ncbi:putative quinol monooxygenase [Paraburkholderia phenoliruptrix]|uniref:putative quinol monooxygenase n=1 Tax=Paraburkholderia phenoliruptrix TaxID=252970 RepID=UPI001C6DD77F|nr:putative quinol monooxygenase [Paraburkholderia phenoliruptrix]MBW9102699.1 antibiotic biosynthesis monooxygenase [Paraburkholderia phenoliruptrix]MBW9128982.1 antibiotic biosynthesis monooxygenase [Paraburkholderia ginsengiterrae]